MIERSEISVADIWSIINEIENNPGLYLLDRIPGRRERLEQVKYELEKFFAISNVFHASNVLLLFSCWIFF